MRNIPDVDAIEREFTCAPLPVKSGAQSQPCDRRDHRAERTHSAADYHTKLRVRFGPVAPRYANLRYDLLPIFLPPIQSASALVPPSLDPTSDEILEIIVIRSPAGVEECATQAR